MDIENSYDSDIQELSIVIDNLYPGLSKDKGFVYYPNVKSFVDRSDCAICFYSKEFTTWDGYARIDNPQFEISKIFTAAQILNEREIPDINEAEFKELFAE